MLRDHMRPGGAGQPDAGERIDLHHPLQILARKLIGADQIGQGARIVQQPVDPAEGVEAGPHRPRRSGFGRDILQAGDRLATRRPDLLDD